MLNSNERMGFIIEYMSSYDEKIKMANKNGLFDAAKMFELFAIEVCNVWFGQKFSNLNDETATYPYVDLISENRELLVQVSTVQDVPTKIKTTLEKIRDSKDKKCSDLKNIVFFVLSNNSIDKVREYSGDNQIGSISFTIKDNLITTNDIITKAQNDLNFQKKLYKVLKDEYENFNINIRKFKGALELSNSGLKNIEGLINGEYEIDRNEFLEKITKDNERYISIQGGAGSGKSVLCKKYVENEKLVLYARAERFLEESHIDDIWGCCIQDVLECINGKKLIFFIDALEFIADCAETKFELLQYLYDMAAEYQNVYIVTSCRTSDKNAFIKLETNFSIKIYEVGDITEDELALLMKQYPIIHKMYKTNSYVDLLKSPFYINLIVSNSMDIDNIGDENSLREYIWKNIICLEEKSRMYGILSNKVIETVEKIVFERARKFMLGIHKDDIDRDIMHALLSEGVIAQQGDYIRLKYDIFEDICFEHYFDKAFDLCKGKYKTFYDEIENLGRCVYRRYQIWISNKMFIQVNRDKFLYSLTFSDEIPQSWKRQTEIGIVKSRFCDNYFEEQGSEILEQGMLFDFVKNINLFAFEGELLHIRQESPQMKLSPIGNGRPCIIRLLKNEEIYKKNIIGRDDIVKLCLDYAKQEDKVAVIASDACAMMEYYVEYSLQESEQENYYKIIDEISSCLEALYRMADNSEEWLKKFFNTLINNYINGNRKSMRKSEDIMEWTLKNAYPALVTGLASELCSIADILWLRGKVDAEEFDFYILYMVDGDKTIIIQDSYRFCCNGKTKIFDGDFYTGYQSFLFEKELQTASIDKSKIAEITINNEVYDIVASNNYVVLSSGIKDLWSDIANAKNLGTIFASPYISADVKYYVVKQLREHGYTIFAYGDSKIDLYMLREADKGFLYIGKRISRSLKNESLSGLVPIYDHSLVILADEDEEVQADIAICKSNSGISGSRLAAAHVRLGEKIGRHIAAVFPEKNTSILVLERGGRFFGDGVYMGVGGIFYSMNPKQDDAPVINTERVVIVDSVINTGKSIMRIIDELKNHNPGIDVIIAANVIQNEAVELFKDYLVFATRLSKNSFVGVNQSKQTGKTGPDTADRLFNLIKKRY